MDEKPVQTVRWFDRKAGEVTVLSWIGVALLSVGAAGALGSAEAAQLSGAIWSPFGVFLFFPIHCIGGAIVIWALRRDSKKIA